MLAPADLRHLQTLHWVTLGGATALLPAFARDILHIGAAGLGALRAAPAAGVHPKERVRG